MAFEIKRGDRRPRYQIQLLQTDPASITVPKALIPVDLTTATGVFFIMKEGASTPKVNRGAMTIVDAVTGLVQYAWITADTDTAGNFTAEVEVMWGTEPQTFPSKGYFAIEIYADLG